MRKLVLSLILFTLTLSVKAQSSVVNQVEKAFSRLISAMESGKAEELNKLVSKDLNYGHSSGKIDTRESFVGDLVTGKSDFVKIETANLSTKVVGDIAIVRHELHAQTSDNGKPGEVHLGVMLIWHLEGKEWKLLARQAFKLPT